jgi:hypothetical protein
MLGSGMKSLPRDRAAITTVPQTLAAGAGPAPPAQWWLTIEHHDDAQHLGKRMVVVPDASLFLGRADGAFDNERISRKHAEVHAEEDGELWIRDCGSRNGTFVNGVRVTRRSLAAGDVIGLGKVLLLVHRSLPAPAVASARLTGMSHGHARVLEQIDKVATRATAVVISGPPGSGKTAYARELHARSKRKGELVMLHCGGIADEVLHRELYGHDKGAFDGADAARVGLLEAADRGTLVLDDVGAASRKLQLALMQFLDSGELRRLGSSKARKVATRVVATSSEPLEELVAAGKLQRDFADRLAGWAIAVPPLSERRDDIGVLALLFARQFGGEDAALDADLSLHLLRRDWPGNVRELEAFIEEAVIDGGGVTPIGLPERVRSEVPREPPEIVIARNGAWFEPRGAERVDLGHRKNLARILAALVAQRDAAPGRPLSVAALTDAGWPGETPVDKSGANRVYVALTTLRQLGLRDVIARDRDGYCLLADARIDLAG